MDVCQMDSGPRGMNNLCCNGYTLA